MKINDQVANILKYDSASRNSDKRLLVVYWQKAGMKLTDEQVDCFMKLPSTETIRRTRQMLQEQGKYPASDAVDKARYQRYQNVRANIKTAAPETLLEQQGKQISPWGE